MPGRGWLEIRLVEISSRAGYSTAAVATKKSSTYPDIISITVSSVKKTGQEKRRFVHEVLIKHIWEIHAEGETKFFAFVFKSLKQLLTAELHIQSVLSYDILKFV
jgi:hypothetical protein